MIHGGDVQRLVPVGQRDQGGIGQPEVELRHRRATSAIRAALRKAVAEVHRPRISAIGVGEGPGDVADNVDRYLDGFGER